MGWRQVLVLWAAFLGLLAQWTFVERQRAPLEERRQPPRPRFLELRSADVAALRIERRGQRLVARHEGEVWQVVEPAGARVPSDLVAAFLEALAAAEEIDQVAATTEEAASFGFGDEAVRVELERPGQPTIVVLLGAENPTGTAVYARQGSLPRIVLIGRNVRYYQELLFDGLPGGALPAGMATGSVGG